MTSQSSNSISALVRVANPPKHSKSKTLFILGTSLGLLQGFVVYVDQLPLAQLGICSRLVRRGGRNRETITQEQIPRENQMKKRIRHIIYHPTLGV